MCIERRFSARHRQRGLTLIELVVFIVVVSIGLVGILGVLNLTTLHATHPMLAKQQLAIAESLLEEVSSKAFTWCDPDDDKVLSATSAAGCTVVQGLAPTPGESRYSSTTPFDNVGDYNGFAMNNGILNPADGTPIANLAAYKAGVVITQAGSALGLADNSAALRIDVTVTAPDGGNITLTGYRTRHAPQSP